MRRDEIPEEVLRFIEHRIDTVPHMEALLLLWGTPLREWTDAEVSGRVYISRDHALRVLRDLARNELIVARSPLSFSYNPLWDETQLLPKVARAYREHLVYVSGLIHAKPASDAVRDFARAFKFKPKE